MSQDLSTYLRETLGPREVALTPGQGLVRLLVGRESLPDAARALAGPLEARLLTAMGRDQRMEHNSYTIHYLFWLPRHRAYLDLVAELPPDDPSFPSLAALLPAADWPERETRDLLGLLPRGHPHPTPLLHRESWPLDYYPLRKDAAPMSPVSGALGVPSIDPGARMGTLVGVVRPPHAKADLGSDSWEETRTGPDDIDGEPGSRTEAIRLFYGHRGIERLCEGRSLTAAQSVIERVCGNCATAHALAFCEAVEAAAGIEIPDVARTWRAVLLELERIRAHLGWVAALCAAAGCAESGPDVAALVEPLLALTAALTESRRATGAIRPGGLSRTIPGGAGERAREALAPVRERWARAHGSLLHNGVLAGRLRGRATLPRGTAERLGAVGPVARASGVEMDCRLDGPPGGSTAHLTGESDPTGGDAAARMRVHLEEIAESLRLLDPLLATAPSGRHSAPLGWPQTGAQGVGRVEAPEGEHLHWLILGPGQTVERLHIRSAAYACWPAAQEVLAGTVPADFQLDLASFGLCTACVDR